MKTANETTPATTLKPVETSQKMREHRRPQLTPDSPWEILTQIERPASLLYSAKGGGKHLDQMLLARRGCSFVEPQKKLVKSGLPCINSPTQFSPVTGRGSSFMGTGITGCGKGILPGLQNRKFNGAHLVPQPDVV